jgi:cellulose synthase/poly-beta-1,6-N-acetylglucosamine synthase-like glycosyltransferase
MQISFVIPAFNEAANIGSCLESIFRELATTRCSFEVVVVDNASTDDTAKVAEGYPGVRVIREPRKGITFARQAGFAASHGDLVANIDADTLLTPGWLGTVEREFARDPALVCLSGPQRYRDVSGWVRAATRLFYAMAFLAYLVARFVLRAGSMVQGGNFVCRRSALESIGGFDTSIQFYGEDTDIARRLHRVGRVKFTFSLPIFASGRRLAGEGVCATGIRYAVNYLWVTASGRPFTRSSRDLRPLPELNAAGEKTTVAR